jgi:hypothetical protein
MANIAWTSNGPHEQDDDGAFYVHDNTELNDKFNEIVTSEQKEDE